MDSDQEQGREHYAAESRLGGMQSCLKRGGALVRVFRVYQGSNVSCKSTTHPRVRKEQAT
jgi:hypothetical protein